MMSKHKINKKQNEIVLVSKKRKIFNYFMLIFSLLSVLFIFVLMRKLAFVIQNSVFFVDRSIIYYKANLFTLFYCIALLLWCFPVIIIVVVIYEKKRTKLMNNKEHFSKKNKNKYKLKVLKFKRILISSFIVFLIFASAFPFLFLKSRIEVTNSAVSRYGITGNLKETHVFQNLKEFEVRTTVSSVKGGASYGLDYTLIFFDGYSISINTNDDGNFANSFQSVIYLDSIVSNYADRNVVNIRYLKYLSLSNEEYNQLSKLYLKS